MKSGVIALMLLLIAGPVAVFGQDAGQAVSDPGKAAETRPNPDADGLYHVGKGVSQPKATFQVSPEFSELARKKKISGNCLVRLIVDAEGKPQNVHVAKSISEGVKPKLRPAALSLDEKAVEAVKQYRFEPAMFEGKAVPVELLVEVNFQVF